jgi:DNA helicase MCM8
MLFSKRSQKSQDGTPITTRQLESIIRLSEARARSELRNTVKKSDAIDVIQMMRMSLWDAFQTTNGNVDFSRSQMGTGSSRQGSSKKFIQQLQEQSNRNNSKEFSRAELESIANRILD